MQEQQLSAVTDFNPDEMETSAFVTDQFLANIRFLIEHAIEAVQNGS